MNSGSKWEVVIGLETHAQLQTKSKIFSGSSVEFGAAPNAQASAVDIALPGVLPVLNREAVVCAIKFGLAVGANIAPRSGSSQRLPDQSVRNARGVGWQFEHASWCWRHGVATHGTSNSRSP